MPYTQLPSGHPLPEPVGWGWRGALLLVWWLGSFVAMYFARELEHYQWMGWPLGYWLAAQGIILGYVALVAWYAWLANRRERMHAEQAAQRLLGMPADDAG